MGSWLATLFMRGRAGTEAVGVLPRIRAIGDLALYPGDQARFHEGLVTWLGTRS